MLNVSTHKELKTSKLQHTSSFSVTNYNYRYYRCLDYKGFYRKHMVCATVYGTPLYHFNKYLEGSGKKSTSRWVVMQCTFQQQARQRTYVQPSLLTKPLLNTGQQPSFNTHTDGPTLGTRYRTRPSSCCISGGDSLSLSAPELDPVSLQLSLSASVSAKVLSQRKIQLEEGSD